MCSQGYIAAVREFLGRENLRQWMHFALRDFQERKSAGATFSKRHLPLSDGKSHSEFGDLLKEPSSWNAPPKPPRRKAKKSKGDKKKVQSGKESTAADVVMIYDVATNTFVPCL